MQKALKNSMFIIMCIAMLGNTACTTMQSIHASQDAIHEMNIKPGDKVTLQYTDGTAEKIKVSSIGEKEITGIADDGRTVVANYDDVISLDHKEVEVMKSAGAAVGVVALGAILIGATAVGAAAAVAGGM